MSAPFNIGEDAISLTMANELVLAYSERRQAIGQSAVAPLTGNDDARDRTIWRAMQDWLEINCTSFVDHVNGPLNPAGDAFLYFTLATWRARAGININGFYRRDGSNGISYGKIQENDMRIKENFEELQKGFGALIWSIESPSLEEWKDKNSVINPNSPFDPDTCAAVRVASEGEFPDLSWIDSFHNSYHHQGGFDLGVDSYGAQYACECAVNKRNYWTWNNFRSKVRHTFPTRSNARECSVYIRKLAPRLGGCEGLTSYNDIDGIFDAAEPPQNSDTGIVELLEVFPETAASIISDKLWIETGTPSVMQGVTCPTPWPPEGQYPWGGRWSWGARANLLGCLSKWNFTNT